MDEELLKLLRSVDTPTVCNAIEVALGKRGFNDFTRGTMLCSAPEEGAIVGYARTAKISAISPPTEAPEIIKERRMDYYAHMASGVGPRVAVVEDIDGADAIGAFWGEINTNVHKGFGLSGALTNGVMRDLGDLPKGFPVIAGSVGPSHAFVHVKEVGMGASIFGLSIKEGDLIHADRHGALVVPPEILGSLANAINKLLETEALILKPAKQENFDIEKFKIAWQQFENSRT